jgi:CheY-like chemotaxis protein
VEGFSAGANDYLPKPFSREELLVRIQFHLELALITRKLNSLRTFSNQIGVFKDKMQIARSAFIHIKNQVPSSLACLINENTVLEKCIRNNSSVAEFKLPWEQFANDQNPLLLDSIDPTNWRINGEKAGSLLYFQWDEFQFFLFREAKIRSFTSQDLEYIKTFLNEIKIVRKNIHAVIFQTEPELLEKLIQIRMQLNQVVYLTIVKPNTEVVFTDPAKTLSLRLSLQNIEIFFEEDSFIRVHRSYLINPKYIKRIVRDKKVLSGYKVKLIDSQLPVGKTYLPAIRKKFPQWFD